MFYEQFEILCKKNSTTPTKFTKDILKLSSSKVTAWKNGSIPKYEILQSIADYFNVTVGFLFDGYSNQQVPMLPVSKISDLNEHQRELLNNYDVMNERGQQALLSYSGYLTQQPENLKADSEDNKVE